jgi:hypothetical protein
MGESGSQALLPRGLEVRFLSSFEIVAVREIPMISG